MQWSKSSLSFLVVLLKRSFSTFVNEIFYLFCCICSGVVGQCVGWSFWRLRDSRPVRQYHMHFSSRDWAVSDWCYHWIQILTFCIVFLSVRQRSKKSTHASKTSIKSKFADLTAKWSKLSRPVPYSKFNFAPAAIKLFVHSSRFDIAAEM